MPSSRIGDVSLGKQLYLGGGLLLQEFGDYGGFFQGMFTVGQTMKKN